MGIKTFFPYEICKFINHIEKSERSREALLELWEVTKRVYTNIIIVYNLENVGFITV